MKRLAPLLLCCACASARIEETKPTPQPAPAAIAQPAPVTPQGPKAMSHEAFKDFVHNLDIEAGDEAKLRLIKSAASHQWFTAAMAGVLIDHVVHRDNKLLAVPLLKDRILDRENAFWLYQHFTYRDDRAKVQEMLEH
jgi:hypothetical protein